MHLRRKLGWRQSSRLLVSRLLLRLKLPLFPPNPRLRDLRGLSGLEKVEQKTKEQRPVYRIRASWPGLAKAQRLIPNQLVVSKLGTQLGPRRPSRTARPRTGMSKKRQQRDPRGFARSPWNWTSLRPRRS